jgi:sulfur carrier protein ThiS
MINYFDSFPKEFYTTNNSSTGLDIVTNITSRIEFDKKVKTNGSSYYDYVVSDGETPEQLSHKFYGQSNKHWIILMMNDIVHPQFDWPLNMNSFESFVNTKYTPQANNTMTGTDWARSNVFAYRRVETRTNSITKDSIRKTIRLDANTYSNTVNSTNEYTLQSGQKIIVKVEKNIVTYYDYESIINESKRRIKILRPEYVDMVERELQDKFTR